MATHTTSSGPALESPKQGNETKLWIRPRDALGNNISDPNLQNNIIVTRGGDPLLSSFLLLQDGTIEVNFTFPYEGTVSLGVTLNGISIYGHPKIVTVDSMFNLLLIVNY